MTRARFFVIEAAGPIALTGLSLSVVMLSDNRWARLVAMSVWLGLSLVGVARASHRYRLWISHERRCLGYCVNCGYDLRGSVGQCPECGHLDERRDWSEL